jgi:hypothetical protein
MTVEQHQRRTRTEILTTRQGMIVGVAAGLSLAAVAGALSSAAGTGAWIPVNAAGSFFLGTQPIPPDFAGAVSYIGLGVMALMGGLLGTLYATAQEPLDTPSLLIIAVYYGGVIWIVSTFAMLSWLNPAVRAVWQSAPVLAGSLAYGAVLGCFAALRNPYRRPAGTVPKEKA